MTEIKVGRCHCGAVEFEVTLENGLADLRRCNCSLCRRKGAIMAGVPLDALRVTKGAGNLSMYQWNTKVAKHYFCKTCGIYTHHARRSNPNEYGFNAACIDGVDPYALGEIPVGDGAAMSLAPERAGG
ncbi:MAG: GFA family protein [Gammaproteobacteria bacterium]